ncbi:MAG: HAMP domain-containing histidine kinase [Bacteroidales bacterium]|nr:HAMP domain-containing histidine kinase [Bacteroidales bacterium]
MNRKSIWLLIILMTLALTGLIFVQAYWIKNAITIKEKQFDQLVSNSLSDIAQGLQEKEAIRLVMEEIEPFGTDSTGIVAQLKAQTDTGFRMVITYDTISADSSALPMKNELIRIPEEHIHTYTDSLVFIEEGQSDTRNGAREITTHKYYFEADMGERILDKKVFLNRIISGMFFIAPSIEKRIRQNELEETMKIAFEQKGLDLAYEYAIVKWNNEPAFFSENYTEESENDYYRVQLFPDDIFNSSNYLSVYFPQKKNFLFRSFGFMIFSSVFLTLVIVMAFSFTILYVFREKKLTEIRNDFVNNMTHELKTPISTISLASQMLGDSSLPTNMKNIDQISRVISEESRRLGYQVEKVLQMAVFDKGQVKLRCKETDMHELIRNIAENYTLQVRSRGGVIETSLNADKFVLEVDSVHITNVLTNLIDNAMKYCSREPEVRISTRNVRQNLEITIRDNGIGISKQDQKRIFEKFYRVPTGNIHTVKGFGLGLSYVKKIIEEHKGSIDVDSQLYEGSTFIILLPLSINSSGS